MVQPEARATNIYRKVQPEASAAVRDKVTLSEARATNMYRKTHPEARATNKNRKQGISKIPLIEY